MKTIVITGSGRGLGFEPATRFRKADFNVVLNDINPAQLETAKQNLEQISGAGKVVACVGDISNLESMQHLAAYAAESCGSNDAMMLGLNMYGTSKRAVTHFTQALAKESEERQTGVLVGRLSPGIMITDFTTGALGGKEKIDLPEKTKKVYNILGDYPDVVADFLVAQMLKNTKNNAHIEWLTNGKAAWRFMTAAFNKRDFFAEK